MKNLFSQGKKESRKKNFIFQAFFEAARIEKMKKTKYSKKLPIDVLCSASFCLQGYHSAFGVFVSESDLKLTSWN